MWASTGHKGTPSTALKPHTGLEYSGKAKTQAVTARENGEGLQEEGEAESQAASVLQSTAGDPTERKSNRAKVLKLKVSLSSFGGL